MQPGYLYAKNSQTPKHLHTLVHAQVDVPAKAARRGRGDRKGSYWLLLLARWFCCAMLCSARSRYENKREGEPLTIIIVGLQSAAVFGF